MLDKEKQIKCRTVRSDLAFDIDLAEGSRTCTLKESTCFASEECDVIRAIFQKVLALLINDKLSGIGIGLETEFLSDEAKFYIWLVSVRQLALPLTKDWENDSNLRFANVAQRSKPLTNHKHIHHIGTHVRRV